MESNKQISRATKHCSGQRRGNSTGRSGMDSSLLPVPPTTPAQQRVYLYIQLNGIKRLPQLPYPLELHLYHVNQSLQKMQERYTNETIIYEREFNMQKPAFAMGIFQDSIEDMNIFSDNPLVVTLYQRIPRHRADALKTIKNMPENLSSWRLPAEQAYKEFFSPSGSTSDSTSAPPTVDHTETQITEEEADAEGEADAQIDERLEFISRGHCDLLQLFQCKRFISNVEVLLYPNFTQPLETATNKKITTGALWHMYSILPLLKNFNFTNLVFITLESVYNAPDALHERAADLGINLSFRATSKNDAGQFTVVPICNFYGFSSQIISEQSNSVVWETIKQDFSRAPDYNTLQMETNSRIELPRLFRHLLYTEGVDFKISEIDAVVEAALVNNSLHRYVLNEQIREVLEAAVAHNQYEILVQLYNETPTNVLYEGVIKINVFGHPGVNSCRFATLLRPTDRARSITKSGGSQTMRPTFTIIKICFFQPIIQHNEPLDLYNENLLKRSKLRRCFDIAFLKEEVDEGDIVKELYRGFYDLISDIIQYIIKRDMRSVEKKQGYFCCYLENLRNLLLKICGSDFNVRMPTKTNIEFREMLTHMHAELMDGIYNKFVACGRESLSQCMVNQKAEQKRTILLMEEYLSICMLGENTLAQLVFDELDVTLANKRILNFYVFLHHVENLNYEAALCYLKTPIEREWDGNYFSSLLEIYINYMMELQSEKTSAEAYTNLLEQLRIFSKKNALDQDTWILLYCYYKNKGFLPGMEFTRWKYENLYDVPSKSLKFVPRSLYELFLPIDCEIRSIRSAKFYEVFKLFARLGAYKFAEVVFDEIAKDCSAIDTYLITTTLKILQRQIDNKFQMRTFRTDESDKGKLQSYYLAHINGNVEHLRGRTDEAISELGLLLSIDKPEQLQIFYFSLLRLGQLSFEKGDYELAQRAYKLCLPSDNSKNFRGNYGVGLSLYYQDCLEEAIEFMARCTEVDLFVPDVWGYLAIMNLRLQRNKRALDCWKMAKLYPEVPLSNAIYDELDKIKPSHVSLLVDDDLNEIEPMES